MVGSSVGDTRQRDGLVGFVQRHLLAKRHIAAVAAFSMLVGWVVVGQINDAVADPNTTSFSQRYSTTALGSLISIGNTLLTCNPNVPPVSPIADTSVTCAQIQASSGTGNANNDNFAMINLDADNDASTVNSSMSELNLPANYKVLWAGLYWGARTDAGTQGAAPNVSTSASENSIKFKAPGDASYRTISANQTWDKSTNQNGMAPTVSSAFGDPYQSFADVTPIVQSAGNGDYWGANVYAATGADRYAGWALTVVYEAPNLPMAKIVIYDGFDFVGGYNGTNTTSTITVATPTPSGEDSPYAQFSLIAYDGDKVGSMAQVGSHYNSANVTLSNPLSPTSYFASTNQYDGTGISASSGAAAPVGWRSPAPANSLGFDVNNNTVTALSDGLTTTDLEFQDPSGSSFWTGMVGVSTYLGGANFTQSTKTAKNLNNHSPAQPGDVIQFTLNYQNTGDSTTADTAENAISLDQIPAGTTYVPGSIKWIMPYSNGASWGLVSVTDKSGDDAGTYIAPNSTYPNGAVQMLMGPTATTTGTTNIISPYNPAGYQFEVKVNPSGTGNIANTACLSWQDASRKYSNDTGKNNGDPVQVDCWAMSSADLPAGNATGTDLGITKLFTPDPAVAQNVATVPASGNTPTKYGTVVAGSALGASITVTNNGTGANDATSVQVTDTTPTGWNVTSITAPSGWTCPTPSPQAPITGGSTITCSTATFSKGTTATINMTGVTDASDTTTASLSNSASISAKETDTNPANNTATDTLTMTRSADLQVTKTASPANPVPGQLVMWTIALKNNGTSDAKAVSLVDTLQPVSGTGTSLDGKYPATFNATQGAAASATPPAVASGTGITNAQCPPANQTNSTATCTIDTLAAGATATMTVTGYLASNVPAGTAINNSASASAATPDPNAANNSAITNPALVAGTPSADVQVTKTPVRTTGTAGRKASWTVTATNNGPSDATNVVFADALPTAILGDTVTVTASRGTCNVSINSDNDQASILCTAGTLAATGTGSGAGQSVSYTISGTIDSGYAGTLYNTGIAGSQDMNAAELDRTDPTTWCPTGDSACTQDPNTANNTANSAGIPVATSYSLQIAKTTDTTTLPSREQDVTYTIKVTNNGPSLASGIMLTDALPTALLQPNSDSSTNTLQAIIYDQNGDQVQAGPSYNRYTECYGPNLQGSIPDSTGTADDGSAIAGNMTGSASMSCNLASIPAGQSWTVQVTMHATTNLADIATDADNPNYDANYAVVNTASATSSDGTAATDQAVISGAPTVDLGMLKQGPASAVAGESGWYTLTATNNSATDATAPLIGDVLPVGLQYTGPQYNAADPTTWLTTTTPITAAGGMSTMAVQLPANNPTAPVGNGLVNQQAVAPIIGCTATNYDPTMTTGQVVECSFYPSDSNDPTTGYLTGSGSVTLNLPVAGDPGLSSDAPAVNIGEILNLNGGQVDNIQSNNISAVSTEVLTQADVQTSNVGVTDAAGPGAPRTVTFDISNNGPSNAAGIAFTIQRSFAAASTNQPESVTINGVSQLVYPQCTNYPEELECSLFTDAALTQPLVLPPGASITWTHDVTPLGSDAAANYNEQIFSYSTTADPELTQNGTNANNYKTLTIPISTPATALLLSKRPLDTTPNPWVSESAAPPAPGSVKNGNCSEADCHPSFVAGSVFVYQLTAQVDQSNVNTRADAQNVIVTDTLPPGFTAESASWPGGTCVIDNLSTQQAWPVKLASAIASTDTPTAAQMPGWTGATPAQDVTILSKVTCNLGTLPGYSGGNSNPVVITISGTLDPATNGMYLNADGTTGDNYAEQVPNFAQISSDTASAAGSPATAVAVSYVDVFEQSDLRIVKTPDSNQTNAGGQLGFTYTVINQGPSSVSHAILTDILPTTDVNGNPLPTSQDQDGNTLPALSIDLTRTTYNSDATVDTQGLNDATFNAAGQTTNIGCQMPVDKGGVIPDLFGKVLTPDGTLIQDPDAGSTVTVDRGDFGPTAPYNLLATPPVTNGVPLNPIANWGWVDNGSTGTPVSGPSTIGQFVCRIGDIPAGASVPLHLIINTSDSIPDGTKIDNFATAGDMAYDPEGDNNTSDSGDITFNSVADLSVSFLSGTTNIAAGNSVTLTAVGSNSGPSAAVDTTPSIVLPVGFIPTSITAPGNTCTWNTVNQTTGKLTPSATAPDGSSNTTFNGPMPDASGNAAAGWVTTNQPTGTTPYDPTTQWALTCAQDAADSASAALWPAGMAATALITVFVPSDTPQQTFSSAAQMESDTTDPNQANNTATATVTVQRISDIGIVKTLVAPNPMQVGSPVTFRFDVTNNGPSKADLVNMSDTVPQGMTYVSSSILSGQLAGQTCPTPTTSGSGNAVITCPLGTLGTSTADNTASVTVTFLVANEPTLVGSDNTSATGSSGLLVTTNPVTGATITPSLCNTAYGSSASMESQVNNNVSAACGTVSQPPGADMAITKKMSAAPIPVAGATVTSTLTVTNNGPQAITSTTSPQTVTVVDPIPADWENVSLSAANTSDVLAACQILDANRTVVSSTTNGSRPWSLACNWNAFSVGTAGAKSILLTGVTASNGLTTTGNTLASLTNTASVSSTWYDPNPKNNTSTATLSLGLAANLVTAKYAVPVGTNCATADLAATAASFAATPSVGAGEDSQWCITVFNNGPSDASTVRVNDVLTPLADGSSPATLTSATITALDSNTTDITNTANATCSAVQARGVACQVGTLPAGATAFLQVQGILATDLLAGAQVVNTATTTSNTANPGGNNVATATIVADTPSADVRVTKVSRRTAVTSGNTVSWTVTVTNYGPADAQNVTFTDTIPTQVSGVTVTAGAGAPACQTPVVTSTGTNINCLAGTLYSEGEAAAPDATLLKGASVTYTIRGTVDPTFDGTLVNYASAVSGAGTTDCASDPTCTQDPDITNNINVEATASDGTDGTITVTPNTDLALVKSGSRTALPGVDAGGTVPVKYFVTITNPGPSTALNVPFTESLPVALLQPYSDGRDNTPTGTVTYYDASGTVINSESLNDAGCYPPGSGGIGGESDAVYDPAPSVAAVSGTSDMSCVLAVPTTSNGDGTYEGGIPAGGSVTVEIDMVATVNLVDVAEIDSDNPDGNGFTVTNTATVDSPADANSANNTGQWTLSGTPQIDLGLTKALTTPSTNSLTSGQVPQAIYTLSITDAPSCVDGSAPVDDNGLPWTFASASVASCPNSPGGNIAIYSAVAPKVIDTLPQGVTFIGYSTVGASNTANPSSSTLAGQGVTCNVITPATETTGDVVQCQANGNMSGGDVLTFNITVAIDPSLDPDDVGGVIVNTATVQSGDTDTEPDPSLSNNTAQTTTPLSTQADVAGVFSVTMLDGFSDNPNSPMYSCNYDPDLPCDYNGPGSARVGQFVITNNGPSTAQDVNFTLTRKVDVVASLEQVMLVPVDVDGNPELDSDGNLTQEFAIDLAQYCIVNTQELQCTLPPTVTAINQVTGLSETVNLGTILPGQGIMLEYGAIIPGYDQPGTYQDTLTVASATPDSNLGNNKSVGTITIGQALSALEVTKSALNTFPNPGNTQAQDDSNSGPHQSWNAGGTFTYQIVVQVPSSEQFLFANGQPVLATVGSNADLPLLVNNPPAAPVGLVDPVTGAVTPLTTPGVVPDDGNEYRPLSPVVDISGNGNYADANNVTLRDPLPVGFTATNVSTTAGSCNIGIGAQVPYSTDTVTDTGATSTQSWSTSLVTCNLGTVHGYVSNTTYAGKDGQMGTADDVTLPNMGEPVTVTITGNIDQNANDMYPGGDSWAELVPNTATASSTTPNGTGTVVVAAPTVANPLAPDTTCVPANDNSVMPPAGVTCLDTLNPATGITRSAATPTLASQGLGGTGATTAAAPGNTGGATAWGTVPVDIVEQADLQITKTPDAATASAGGTIGYTLSVTNSGPSGLEHVVITDQLPKGFTVDLTNSANAQCVSPQQTTADGSNQWNISPTVDGNQITIPASSAGDDSAAEPVETPSGTTTYNTPTTKAPAIACVGGATAPDSSGNLVQTPMLGAGQTSSIHIVANIDPGYAEDGTTGAANTATVGSHAVDSTCTYPADNAIAAGSACGNNTSTAQVEVSAASDLAVTIDPSAQNVNDGSAVTVSAQVSDNGPSAAVNVHGVVTFPPGFVPETVTVPTMDGNAMVQCVWNDTPPYAGAPDGGSLSIATTGGTWTSANGTDDDNAGYYEGLTYNSALQYSMTCSQIADSSDETPVWPVGASGSITATLWVPPDTPAGIYGGSDADDPAGVTASVQAQGQDATTPVPCPNSTNECLIAADGSIDPDASNNLAAGSITVLSSDTVDVGLTMTGPDPATAVPGDGQSYAYVLTATDLNGPDNKIPAQGVTVTDTLPAGVSFDPTNSSPGCSAVSNADGTTTVTCALGTILEGAYANATVAVKFAANLTGDVVNTASVAVANNSPYQETDLDNNTASATTAMVPAADLATTMTPTTQDANPGSDVTWSIVLTNSGPSDAVHPTLTATLADATGDNGDPLSSPGATLTSAEISDSTAPGTGSCTIVSSAEVTCEGWDSLPVDATITVTVSGSLDSDLPGGTIINVAAAGASGTPDADTANDTANAQVTINPSAQVSINQTLAPDPVDVGGALTATLTVANAGPSGATNTVVTDTIPAGWTDVSVALAGLPDGTSCSVTPAGSSTSGPLGSDTVLQPGDTLTCDLGTLPSGDNGTITLSGVVAPDYADSDITNTATVTSDTPNFGATDSDTKTVQVGVTQLADLAVSATVATASTDPDDGPTTTTTGEPGTQATWILTLTNNGPSAATNPTLFSAFDPTQVSGLTVVQTDDSAATGTGSCTVSDAGNLDCSGWDTLPSGATITVQVTGTLSPTLPGGTDVTTTTTASSDTTDNDKTNNAASAIVTVLPSAALSIDQTLTPDPVIAGTTLTSSLAVTNAGPSGAENTVLTDQIPASWQNVTVASVTVVDKAGNSTELPAATCAITGQTLTCDLGTVPAGATATATLTGSVAPDAAGTTLTNSATVTSSTPNLGATNTASTTKSVQVNPAPPLTCTPPEVLDKTGTKCETPIIEQPEQSSKLTISGTLSPSPVIAGTTVTAKFVIANTGKGSANDTVVTISIPSGLTVSTPPDGCSLTPATDTASASLTCPVGNLGAGASRTISVPAMVASDYPGTEVSLPATATANASDPSKVDTVSTTASAPVERAYDLGIAASASSGTVPTTPSEKLTFTVTATNHGPSAASGPQTMTDNLPVGLRVGDISSPAGWTCELSSQGSMTTGAVVTCNLDPAANWLPNESATFAITTTLDAGYCSASATAAESALSDVVAGNKAAIQGADSVYSADATLEPGNDLPAGTELGSPSNEDSASQAASDGTDDTGSELGSVAGADKPAGTGLPDGASVNDATGTGEAGAGGAAADGAGAGVSGADVADADGGEIQQDDGQNKTESPEIGDSTTATVSQDDAPTLANTGGSPIFSLLSWSRKLVFQPLQFRPVAEWPNLGVAVANWTTSPVTTPVPEQTPAPVTIPAPVTSTAPIPSPATVGANAVVTAATPAIQECQPPLTLTNTATISADQGAVSNPANNTAVVELPGESVPEQADLAVTITPNPATTEAGSDVTWTLTATNLGTATAHQVKLTQSIDDASLASLTGVQVVSEAGVAALACSIVAGAVECTADAFVPNGSITIVVSGTLAADLADQTAVASTASITSATADPAAWNNTASATITVTAPAVSVPAAQVSIAAELSPKPVTVGKNLTATFTVVNDGPDDAQDVVVTIPVPTGWDVSADSLPPQCALQMVAWPAVRTAGSAAGRSGLTQTTLASSDALQLCVVCNLGTLKVGPEHAQTLAITGMVGDGFAGRVDGYVSSTTLTPLGEPDSDSDYDTVEVKSDSDNTDTGDKDKDKGAGDDKDKGTGDDKDKGTGDDKDQGGGDNNTSGGTGNGSDGTGSPAGGSSNTGSGAGSNRANSTQPRKAAQPSATKAAAASQPKQPQRGLLNRTGSDPVTLVAAVAALTLGSWLTALAAKRRKSSVR